MGDSWDSRHKYDFFAPSYSDPYTSSNDWFKPSLADPMYDRGYDERSETLFSNDNDGNTLFTTEEQIMVMPPQYRRTKNPGWTGELGEPRRRQDIGVDTRNWGRKEQEQRGIASPNYPVFTGGTFLRPEFLPPVRSYHLQGAVRLI